LAADSGAEAIGIGNGFDPGLWEVRELLDVPVLGLFETVAFYALRLGWRLGVLCSGSSGPARIEELATRYGIVSRLVRPIAVDTNVPTIMTGFHNPVVAEGILTACANALNELAHQGAEIAMIASGALDILFQVHREGRETVIPVVPATRVLARELEAAAALARLGVPASSRIGRFRMPPQSVQDAVRIRS
jgi:allantoin racemase